MPQVDWRDLATALDDGAAYQRRADRHRPADDKAIAAEVRRLAATGLSAMDIAQAIGIAWPAVVAMLEGAA